ncbi:hypothetical protein K438DRAFT_1770008 [Mycena galopus ATCC 62051]|nr:hypothetical protein K438DRAFT_1770008 [Mycena galopus ATCC 62051]
MADFFPLAVVVVTETERLGTWVGPWVGPPMGVMTAIGTGETAHRVRVPIRRTCTFNMPNMACNKLAGKLTNLHTRRSLRGFLTGAEDFNKDYSARGGQSGICISFFRSSSKNTAGDWVLPLEQSGVIQERKLRSGKNLQARRTQTESSGNLQQVFYYLYESEYQIGKGISNMVKHVFPTIAPKSREAWSRARVYLSVVYADWFPFFNQQEDLSLFTSQLPKVPVHVAAVAARAPSPGSARTHTVWREGDEIFIAAESDGAEMRVGCLLSLDTKFTWKPHISKQSVFNCAPCCGCNCDEVAAKHRVVKGELLERTAIGGLHERGQPREGDVQIDAVTEVQSAEAGEGPDHKRMRDTEERRGARIEMQRQLAEGHGGGTHQPPAQVRRCIVPCHVPYVEHERMQHRQSPTRNEPGAKGDSLAVVVNTYLRHGEQWTIFLDRRSYRSSTAAQWASASAPV